MNDLVISFGEVLWDLLQEGAVLGGAPANCAFRLHSLGVPVRLISRIGTDERGGAAMTELQALGLQTDFLQRDAHLPTGTVSVTVTQGMPQYIIHRDVAYDNIELTKELLALADQAKFIAFGTLAQRSSRSRETLYGLLDAMPHATRLVDINLRNDCYTTETLLASLQRCDMVKMNDDEVVVVSHLLGLETTGTSELAAYLFETFPLQICLVTCGESGVIALQRDGESVRVAGKSVEVVDTIGAGDAFTAGFISQYVGGKSLRQCCEFGNVLGALVATTTGGTTEVPLTVLSA